jgi:hypothetical protein
VTVKLLSFVIVDLLKRTRTPRICRRSPALLLSVDLFGLECSPQKSGNQLRLGRVLNLGHRVVDGVAGLHYFSELAPKLLVLQLLLLFLLLLLYSGT